MTGEQKFFFDVRGWLLLPGVLSEAECAPIREHLLSGGNGYTGPAQALLDHPAVTPILHEILSDFPPSDEFYGFRCENSFTTIRKNGWKPGETERPHTVRPPQFATEIRYQCEGGKIYSGLTRVVWELNPVRKGDGGTRFLTGSHKARIEYPESVLEIDNTEMESYDCPAGSVIIFSESLLHASTAWTNPEVDRVAIFNCYNSLWAQWHRLHLPPETFEAMPPKRRSLFRGVWAADFTTRPVQRNTEYAEDNRAL